MGKMVHVGFFLNRLEIHAGISSENASESNQNHQFVNDTDYMANLPKLNFFIFYSYYTDVVSAKHAELSR